MKNKFSITITDINGSKHFYLNQIIKKVVLYIIIFILSFLILGAFYIKYLDSQVSKLDEKRQELAIKSKDLQTQNEQMQKSLEEKAEQYSAIEDKIASFEESLGISVSENNASIDERLETLNLSNEQQNIILSQIPNGYPLKHNGISSNFGWRVHPITKRREFHPGIDLRADVGTPLYAPADAVVEHAGFTNNGYGYNVILLHNFGFKTVLAHMQRKDVVQAGQFVKKGDLIGYSGNTGLSTGPHLHYEVRFINKTLEPLNFLNLQRKNMYQFFNQERRVPWQSLTKAVSLQATQTTKQQ